MKACVLHKVGDLRVEDVPTPKPQKGEVLVKIKASGICGSDIQRVFVKGTYHFPTIPGHEFSGEIAELGKGVDPSYLGKKVAVFPLLPCMKCDNCQIGQYAQCINYNYFGSRCDGGFAEYIAVPVWNLVFVPDSLSYEEAAMCEPSAVAVHALRQGEVEIGDTIIIYGAGTIGLLLGLWAKAMGTDKVLLVDIDESKITFAKKIGFQYVWNSNDGNPITWVKKVTEDRGADISIEGVGISITLEQCLKSVRTFGKVIAMGNPIGDMILSQKGYWEILRKQLKIMGTWNSSYVSLPKNDWKLTIHAMEKRQIDVKELITHKIPLTDGIKPFEMIRDKKEFFNKVIYVMK